MPVDPAVADEQARVAVRRAGKRTVCALRGAGHHKPVKIERPVQPHVDQAGNAALDVIRAWSLFDIDARQELGRNILQRHEAAG